MKTTYFITIFCDEKTVWFKKCKVKYSKNVKWKVKNLALKWQKTKTKMEKRKTFFQKTSLGHVASFLVSNFF